MKVLKSIAISCDVSKRYKKFEPIPVADFFFFFFFLMKLLNIKQVFVQIVFILLTMISCGLEVK